MSGNIIKNIQDIMAHEEKRQDEKNPTEMSNGEDPWVSRWWSHQSAPPAPE